MNKIRPTEIFSPESRKNWINMDRYFSTRKNCHDVIKCVECVFTSQISVLSILLSIWSHLSHLRHDRSMRFVNNALRSNVFHSFGSLRVSYFWYLKDWRDVSAICQRIKVVWFCLMNCSPLVTGFLLCSGSKKTIFSKDFSFYTFPFNLHISPFFNKHIKKQIIHNI